MQLSVELNFGERTVYFLIGDRSDTSRKKESEAFPLEWVWMSWKTTAQE